MNLKHILSNTGTAITGGKARHPRLLMAMAGAITLVGLTGHLSRGADSSAIPSPMPNALFPAERAMLGERDPEATGTPDFGAIPNPLGEMGEWDVTLDRLADAEVAPETIENRDRILAELASLETMVDSIQERKFKVEFLLRVAHVYGKLGASDRALALLETAQQSAWMGEELVGIARVYQEMGETDRAIRTLKVAESVVGTHARPLTFSWVAIARAYQGLEEIESAVNALAQAEAAAHLDEPEMGHPPKIYRLMWIARLYGTFDKPELAGKALAASLASVDELEDVVQRSSALLNLGRIAGEVGDGEQMSKVLSLAQAEAAEIDSEDIRVFNLIAIARTYQEFAEALGTGDDAIETLQIARQAVDTLTGKWAPPNALLQVAQIYNQLGQEDRALEAVDDAEKTVDDIEVPETRVFALLTVAQVYSNFEESDRAMAALVAAGAQADQIESESSRIGALLSLAQAYANVGESDRVAEAMEAAITLSKTIESQQVRAFQTLSIAQSYRTLERRDQAMAAMPLVQTAIDSLPEEDPIKINILHQVARAYEQLGDSDRALQNLMEAQALIQSQGDAHYQSFFLHGISQTFKDLGASDRALAAMETAQAASESLEDSWSRASALTNISRGYRQLGESDRAFAVLESARAASADIDETRVKTNALVAIAFAYLQLGESDQDR